MLTIATTEEIQAMSDRPEYVTYISMVDRPGLLCWMVEVEYTQFKPDTDANDDFHLSVMKWPDEIPMFYNVAHFHRRAQEFAESILWKNGLRKVPEGFVPSTITNKGLEYFPVQGPSVFSLENHSQGAPNVIYANDPVKRKAAHDHELAQCQVFFDAHTAWINTPEGKAIADAYWVKNPEGYNR